MKKTLFASALLIAFGIAPVVFAAGFTALAPIPGLTDSGSTSVVNATTLANFFNNLYKYLIGVAAVLAVIEIIWGGLEIAINKESASMVTEGKGRIVQALLGLVLVLSPVLVFSIINPSILNLSLDLPALNTAPAASSNSTSNPNQIVACQDSSTLQWGQYNPVTKTCDTTQSPPNFSSCTTSNGQAGTYMSGKGCVEAGGAPKQTGLVLYSCDPAKGCGSAISSCTGRGGTYTENDSVSPPTITCNIPANTSPQTVTYTCPLSRCTSVISTCTQNGGTYTQNGNVSITCVIPASPNQ